VVKNRALRLAIQFVEKGKPVNGLGDSPGFDL
jgi:hypothetical protein